MADESLGWQKAPQSPEQFGGLADKIANLERQLANIESRTVLGTVSARSNSGYTSGFGVQKNETVLLKVSVPAPSNFTTVVVQATIAGRAVWDNKQGGTAGSGDWGLFYSRLTVENQIQATGTAYYAGGVLDAKGVEQIKTYRGILTPTAQLALPAEQVTGSVDVTATAWTNWPAAYHADSESWANLQVQCLFIR